MTVPKLLSNRLVLRGIKNSDFFQLGELYSDKDGMELFGRKTIKNDWEIRNIIDSIRVDTEKGYLYYWVITLPNEGEFVGFIRLISYNSYFYDASFDAIGEMKYDSEFLKHINRNGWELDYALLANYRAMGIMSESVSLVLNFCSSNSLKPIYAKVNSLKNVATVKILKKNSFKNLMPLISDIGILNKYDVDTIITNKQYGMLYVRE